LTWLKVCELQNNHFRLSGDKYQQKHLLVLMDTLLGTVVTVLVVWTKFWYKPGSPSFGTKLVGTIEAILTLERRK
jgi:hypothetical protein